jgi:hypothetical protein
MRAATALPSLLTPGGAPAAPALAHRLWRADDLPAPAAATALSSGFAALDAELPGGGWPLGQLIELLLDEPGVGELLLLTPALARLSSQQRACVWVLPVPAHDATVPPGSPAALPYAPALQSAGLDLARCMFVQPATPREGAWALEQSLRAGAHLGAVIGWLPGSASGTPGEADFRALRRLQLLAAQTRALLVVLRPSRHAAAASPATLRLQLAQADGRLQVQVLKRRGRPLLEPLALQVHPESWRQARVAPPLAAEPVELPPVTGGRADARLERWSLRALFSH